MKSQAADVADVRPLFVRSKIAPPYIIAFAEYSEGAWEYAPYPCAVTSDQCRHFTVAFDRKQDLAHIFCVQMLATALVIQPFYFISVTLSLHPHTNHQSDLSFTCSP